MARRDRMESAATFGFFCTLHSQAFLPSVSDTRKEVTVPPAGHKQRGSSSFWLITRGPISPSTGELGRNTRLKR